MATGNVALTLDPDPGSIDGHVGGFIEIPQGLSPDDALCIELSCTRFRYRNHSTSSNSSLLWKDVCAFGGQARDDGSLLVPFCFSLPSEAPLTSEGPGDRNSWVLQITSARGDAEFGRRWTIPVLSTGQLQSADAPEARSLVHAVVVVFG